MFDWNAPSPYVELLGGLGLLVLAVGGTFTGETLARFHGWVYRTDDPKGFRWLLVIYYLGGFVLIGRFLCDLHGLHH
jgi:hypothetical protein